MIKLYLVEKRNRQRQIGAGGLKGVSHLTRILNRTKTAFDSTDADDKSEPTSEQQQHQYQYQQQQQQQQGGQVLAEDSHLIQSDEGELHEERSDGTPARHLGDEEHLDQFSTTAQQHGEPRGQVGLFPNKLAIEEQIQSLEGSLRDRPNP